MTYKPSKRFANDFEVKINPKGKKMIRVKGSDWVKSLIVQQLKKEVKGLGYKAHKSPFLSDKKDQAIEMLIRNYVDSSIDTLLPAIEKLFISRI